MFQFVYNIVCVVDVCCCSMKSINKMKIEWANSEEWLRGANYRFLVIENCTMQNAEMQHTRMSRECGCWALLF